MNQEKTISSETLFQGIAVRRLRIDTIQKPDGSTSTREVVEHEPVVAIVPVNSDGKILMVRQFRHAVGKEMLEIPAGGIEPGEDPVDAVKREMSEETGFMPRKVERLGGFYSAPGFCDEYLYLFLATDLVPNRLVAEDTDEITLEPMDLNEALRLVMFNTICDSKSIAGLFTYREYLKNQKSKLTCARTCTGTSKNTDNKSKI